MLGYLALAGPFYVAVSLIQGLTRSGFDLARDEWSLLANGHLGWIQVINLILTGLMTLIGAVGLRRGLGRSVPGGTWAPRLIATYGIALVGAGLFRADPADGYPPGTPPGRAVHITWHGTLHIVFGSVGFACMIVACFVIARHYSQSGQPRAGVIARVVGIVFAVSFAGIATGSSNIATNLVFTAAIIISYAWMTGVAVDVYRGTRIAEATARSQVTESRTENGEVR